jgi:hypothetical protein
LDEGRLHQSAMRPTIDWRSWRWPTLLIIGVAYSVLAFFTPRLPFTVPRLCPFYLATGRDCPLCGLTRGLGLIAQGRVQEAFGKYPRALLVGLAGTGIAVWLFWKQASSQMKEAACRLIYKH